MLLLEGSAMHPTTPETELPAPAPPRKATQPAATCAALCFPGMGQRSNHARSSMFPSQPGSLPVTVSMETGEVQWLRNRVLAKKSCRRMLLLLVIKIQHISFL